MVDNSKEKQPNMILDEFKRQYLESTENSDNPGNIPSFTFHLAPNNYSTKHYKGQILRNRYKLPSDKVVTDFWEDEKVVTLFVYIKNVVSESLLINIEQNMVCLKFKLSDTKNMPRSCDECTIFEWSTKLRHPVLSSFTHKLNSMKVEISLTKQSPGKWGGLDPLPETNVSEDTWDLFSYFDSNDDNVNSSFSNIPTDVWLPYTENGDIFSRRRRKRFQPRTDIAKSKELDIPKSLSPIPCSMGYTGLDNLGNTCFMNSVFQCLSNTEELRDYFISQHFKEDLNSENALGTGGKLAWLFYSLLKQLWSGEHSSYSPYRLKSLIGDKVSQFSGFAQHDAHEYMVFLLDTLHEDVNRVKKKPYIENNDDKNMTDEELANDSWKKYRMRNDSVIIDLFYGQYKSKLTCPECPKLSVTFDPFLFLPLPIPKNRSLYNIYLFRKDTSKKPERRLVRLPANSYMKELYEILSSSTGISSSCFRSITVKDGVVKKILSPSSLIPSNKEILLIFESLDPKLYNEHICEFLVHQRVAVTPSNQSICTYCRRAFIGNNKPRVCTGCYRSVYCSEECETQDSPYHINDCIYDPEPIGCPFFMFIPQSMLTYPNLCQMISDYSRHSVDVNFSDSRMGIEGELPDAKDNDSGIFSDTIENNSPSTPSSPSSIGVEQRFMLRHHPTHIDFSVTKDNLILEPSDLNDEMPNLAYFYYLTVEWKTDKNLIVETKDLDHSYDILEASKIADSDEYSLEECLKLFSEPEVLSAKEAWYCPDCKEHRQATKQLILWRLPQILIIQLKRFLFTNHMFRNKIEDIVRFPLKGLDLTEYCCPNILSSGTKPIYDLYAVVNHYGDMSRGHYTAYAKTRYNDISFGWREFNDAYVSDVNEENVITGLAYILFYRLRDEKDC